VIARCGQYQPDNDFEGEDSWQRHQLTWRDKTAPDPNVFQHLVGCGPLYGRTV
jgi:hypothetical protein